MMILARFRILTKILAIVVGLSVIASALAYLGISSLKSLSQRGEVLHGLVGTAARRRRR